MIIESIKAIETLEQCAEIYPAAYNAEPWNDNWTTETAKALLTCYYCTPNFMGWVARRNGVIIGCAIGNMEPYYNGNIFILKELFVKVSAQGSGVGRSLIIVIKEEMKKIDIKTVMLFTRRPLFDFYIKSGFQEMEEAGTMVYACE
ncbi:MAG: GNAT family N-acetyltransferase [Mucilaginibacter sp.]|uniref:GNAT family N-acetyltransferase n=1 Tax=Mucilaginibacter sp. TaxID=1882438 RepID=UPI0031B45A56